MDIGFTKEINGINGQKTPADLIPLVLWKEIATKFFHGTLVLGEVNSQFKEMTREIAKNRKWEKICSERTPLKADPFRGFIQAKVSDYRQQQPLYHALHTFREQLGEPWKQIKSKDCPNIQIEQFLKSDAWEIGLPGKRTFAFDGTFIIRDHNEETIAYMETTFALDATRHVSCSQDGTVLAAGLENPSRTVFWIPDIDPLVKRAALLLASSASSAQNEKDTEEEVEEEPFPLILAAIGAVALSTLGILIKIRN